MSDVVISELESSLPARPVPGSVESVDRRRVLIGTGVVIVVALAVVWLVRLLPTSGAAPVALAVVLGLLVLPVIASPVEWFVHRFVYHEAVIRPLTAIYMVHTVHHYTYFPTWRYVTAGPARRLSITNRAPKALVSRLRNAGVRLAHFSFYMALGAVLIWLPAWFLTRDVPFLVGIVAASVVVSNLFIVVHDTIHRPGSHRIVEAQPWFAFLDRHHYIHHVALGTNLNFLLPLADVLFGTLRRELTPEELAEHGPLERAKATSAGQGEKARAAVA
ncbi:MAG TPA: hypothetical protein VF834_14105 [Streptosporangiaceae bacterium]